MCDNYKFWSNNEHCQNRLNVNISVVIIGLLTDVFAFLTTVFGKIMILLDPARLAFRTSFKSQGTIYQQLKSKRDYIVKGSNLASKY